MKTYFALLLVTVAGLKAEIEFSGFFATAKEAYFSLTDTETKRSSGWLKIGQTFGDYTLTSFDLGREVITVAQGKRALEIPLRQSRVKDGRATVSGSLKFLNQQLDGVCASLFFDEEVSFPLNDGITFRIKPEKLSDGNVAYHAKFVRTDKSGVEEVLSAPSVVAIPGYPFSIQVGDFGYSFTP